MTERMNDTLAMITERDYVCAICWGHLLRNYEGKGIWTIECSKYPEHEGFVTKYYVGQRRSESIGDAMDIRNNLRGILPSENDGKTAEELIKELGI